MKIHETKWDNLRSINCFLCAWVNWLWACRSSDSIWTKRTKSCPGTTHLVREQHLLLYLRESIVNQWSHQWSKIASTFQSKVEVTRKAKTQKKFSVFALRGRLPGQLASHRWSDVGMGKYVCSFINGMTLQLHIVLPKNCDLSENLKCAMYAMCKSVKVGFPQPVEDFLTFNLSSFFTSQADAILNAHAGNVLRRMKCPLRHQGCLPRHKRDDIQRTSETCCNSLQLRFPRCPQWNHVRTKNEIPSTRSTVALITALAKELDTRPKNIGPPRKRMQSWGSLEVTLLGGMGGQSLG